VRVTIQIKPRHRRALKALAAARGQRGYSKILAEAIQEYAMIKGVPPGRLKSCRRQS